MNHGTRVVPRLRGQWSTAERPVAAVIATVVLALLVAACGGRGSSSSSGSPSSTGSGGSSNAGGSTSSPSAVGFSRCMRSHGVPNYPDPDINGVLPKTDPQRLGVSTSQFQAAQQACPHLLPTTGSFQQQARQCIMAPAACPPALMQQIETAERQFARCMRSHGLPKFPDPTIDSQGRPVFAWSISKTGMDPDSSQFAPKEDECGRLTGSPEPRAISP
jgi:hypothetical protein